MHRGHPSAALGLALLVSVGCGQGRSIPQPGRGASDQTFTDGAGQHWYEHGSGEYATFLKAADPPRFCWYIEKSTRVDSSGRRDYSSNICHDGLDDSACLAGEPASKKTDTASLYLTIDYQTVGDGALFGTCNLLDRYWRDDPEVECLYHRHCGGGTKCFEYRCACKDGDSCQPNPTPEPAGNPGGSGGGMNPGSPEPTPSPTPSPTAPAIGTCDMVSDGSCTELFATGAAPPVTPACPGAYRPGVADCPSTGRLGTCTLDEGGLRFVTHAYAPQSRSSAEQACRDGGGRFE